MYKINIAKFGGTSMANAEAMERCADIVLADKDIRLVVVSSSAGITNKLISLASKNNTDSQRQILFEEISAHHHQILNSITDAAESKIILNEILSELSIQYQNIDNCAEKQFVDKICAFGEQLSSFLFNQIFSSRRINSQLFDARSVIKTDSCFGHAEPKIEHIKKLATSLLAAKCQKSIVITQGYVGSDAEGHTTTLGRGGSDYSAALLAEALEGNNLQIWTDVEGIFTTDPRLTKKASVIPEISFNEAAELATFGAKILHPSTLWPAIRKNISVFVGSSRDRHAEGTWIRKKVIEQPNYRAIAMRSNQTLLTITSISMLHSYGFLAKAFSVLAKHKISVDLVTTSEVSVALTLDIPSPAPNTATPINILPRAVLDELGDFCEVSISHDLALIAVVGNNIEQQTGTSSRIFNALSKFNLRLICHGASSHNICFLVAQKDANNVICNLHQELFESEVGYENCNNR